MKRKEMIQARLIGLMDKERETPFPEKGAITEQVNLLKWVLF